MTFNQILLKYSNDSVNLHAFSNFWFVATKRGAYRKKPNNSLFTSCTRKYQSLQSTDVEVTDVNTEALIRSQSIFLETNGQMVTLMKGRVHHRKRPNHSNDKWLVWLVKWTQFYKDVKLSGHPYCICVENSPTNSDVLSIISAENNIIFLNSRQTIQNSERRLEKAGDGAEWEGVLKSLWDH